MNQSGHATPHVANWVSLLAESLRSTPAGDFLERWESAIFSFMVAAIISIFTLAAGRDLRLIPGRVQAAMEELLERLDTLVCSVMGPQGRAYTPFVGSLFIYILVTNLYGLLPLQSSSTSYLTTTAPLAVCVFFYVQIVSVLKNGFPGYLYHLAGSPRSFAEWLFVPLNFPLHVMGEFVKPVSLMFRLYGNVMAGHILVAVFLQLGIQALRPLHIPVGVPFHVPFLFLEIMVGTIQAFVFALLSTVYIVMMLPHESGSGTHGPGEEAQAHSA